MTDFYLNNFTDAASVADAIRNLSYRGGSTYLGEGLRVARTEIFHAANGDRPDAVNVIILVTAGLPDDMIAAVLSEVSIIESLNITIIGVGVGSGVRV